MNILVYDFGLYSEHAITLGRAGHTVRYFCQWQEKFPKSDKTIVGDGFPEIERHQSFWKHVDWSDIIVFFDTNTKDIAEYLIEKGYTVFAPGESECLEANRWDTRKLQKELGLPTQRTVKIDSIEALDKYLKTVKDKYVKLDVMRGDCESFHHVDYDSSKPILNHLQHTFGAYGGYISFIVENPITEAIEAGYDGFVIDGEYPECTLMGYEIKDEGYIGKIIEYDDIVEPVKLVNEKLSKTFKDNCTRSMFSTEVRIDKKGDGYLIDTTVRAPNPPSVSLEIFSNFADIIIGASEGRVVEPIPVAKYGVEICLYSEWVEDDQLEIKFPESIRRFVKLKNAFKKDGKYYCLPGWSQVCSVIGLGDSLESAIEHCKSNVDKVDAIMLKKNINWQMFLDKEEESNKNGISF